MIDRKLIRTFTFKEIALASVTIMIRKIDFHKNAKNNNFDKKAIDSDKITYEDINRIKLILNRANKILKNGYHIYNNFSCLKYFYDQVNQF